MSCFSKNESNFADALNSFLSKSPKPKIFKRGTTLEFKRVNTVWKGRDFVKSINELKSLTGSEKHHFYDNFLDAATDTLNNPTKENYAELKDRLRELETNLSDPNYFSSRAIGWKISIHSLGLILGLVGAFSILIILASAATAAAAAPVVFGLLAFALTFIGIALICYEIQMLYQDIKYVRGGQAREISDFVNYLRPFVLGDEADYDARQDQFEEDGVLKFSL